MHGTSIDAARCRDRADHVARERKGEWAHQQPDHERRAADQLQPSDQIGRPVGEGNAVALEGAPLGVVADELTEREPEEGDAGRQSHGQRRLRQWLPACRTAGCARRP